MVAAIERDEAALVQAMLEELKRLGSLSEEELAGGPPQHMPHRQPPAS